MLSGCVEKSSVLMDDSTCQYPCWLNIIPGQTSFAQSVEIVSKSLLFDTNRFSPTPGQIVEEYGYSSWLFIKNVRELGLTIYDIDGYVVLLDFAINRNIQIEEMINYYGEPQYISVISGTEDTRWLDVSWIFPSKGVVISLFDPWWKPEGEFARISPELDVSYVYYFNPEDYELLMEKEMLVHNTQDIVIKSIQPWDGYGLFSYVEE